MEKDYYTVGEIFKLGLLMRRGGPLKSKPEVLRRVRKLKHEVLRRNGQNVYAVALSEILAYNATKQKSVTIPILEDADEFKENQ